MNDIRLRNEKSDLMGRSAVLNTAAIVLNLIAVFFIVKGFHDSTTDYRSLYIYSGFGILFITIFSLFMLKGMFLYSYIARVLVGGLFIVSGLIKANDPWGFAFKLEEYFAPDGLAMDYPFFEIFEPYVLELSILICVVEIVLGVAVILGGKIKLAVWSLVVMMAFFSWLTFYTFSCNEQQLLAMELGEDFTQQCVTDCGCFGDALRGSVGRSLTPIESFWKDLVLFYFCLIIFVNQWKIKLNNVKENWIMIPASLIVVAFFSWVFGWFLPIIFALVALLGAIVAGKLNIGKIHTAWKMAYFVAAISLLFSLYTSMWLPIKDYRPYAIGNNIQEQMDMGEAEVVEFVFQYKNKQTGEIEEFTADQYEIYGNTDVYEYHDRVGKVIKAGVDAPISDFLARIDYSQLSEAERSIPFIDSLIQAEYDTYYEEKMILTSEWGADTIAAFTYDTLYYPDSVYTIQEKYTGLVDPGMPFSLNVTDYLLSADYIFLMTIRDIKTAADHHIEDFKAVYEGAQEKGIPFFVLSPAGTAEIAAFKEKAGFSPTFLSFDGIEVKIIVRSNPGLVLLNKGTVLDKWPHRSIQDFEYIYEDYIQPKQN